LLLGAAVGKWHVEVVGRNAEESAYVEMTRRMAACFPARGGEFDIEPDASSGSYFQAAGWLWGVASAEPGDAVAGVSRVWRVAEEATRLVTVADWPATDWQIDARFPGYLPLPRTISREHDLGDSIMTAVIVAADQAGGRVWRPDPDKPRWLVAREVADEPILFTDLARLRVQECERVVALRQELAKCGADIVESGDTLLVRPSALRGAEIDSRNDHRLAMCFAILGLKVPGMKINNPACVKKTFPDFFVKLVQPPPAGLGVAVRDVRLRRRLGPEELIAD
jgi:3-phosphoshikimate 1-carboxyvinyltransferase